MKGISEIEKVFLCDNRSAERSDDHSDGALVAADESKSNINFPFFESTSFSALFNV